MNLILLSMRDVKRENGREIFRSELDDSIVWAIIIVFLCIISFKHYLLFHSLVELFSVVAACTAFIIIWKSKSLILNVTIQIAFQRLQFFLVSRKNCI